MEIAWGREVSREFLGKVLGICVEFNWPLKSHASYLMACIDFESAGTFRSDIRNMAGSGATGLIQFMPSTAKGLGTTVADLAAMTPERQLDYVAAYFKPYAANIHTLSDMYMAILMPAYVGKPDSSVLFVAPNTNYRQNSGLDADRDGRVTKGEATAMVRRRLELGLADNNKLEASICLCPQEGAGNDPTG